MQVHNVVKKSLEDLEMILILDISAQQIQNYVFLYLFI